MHPHWYSASPEVQRKLVSLFILSFGPKSPISTLSPAPSSPQLVFENELNYTRDPHDIASVLRWGLRHLRLEGSSFGKDSTTPSEWAWYVNFATAEREGGYPSTAFSKSLIPLLPPAHSQLLAALFDTMSSLAAHAETTGTSGSKLAKLFGLWLLSTERVKSSEDWAAFYRRWERAGRVLEHLFLAHIREEAEASKMPLRLSELVKQYPYLTAHEKDASGAADDLPYLPIPRFSTRPRDAIFVRVDTLLPSPTTLRPVKDHPLHFISEALKTAAPADAFASEEVRALWEEIKAKASEGADDTPSADPVLSKILDDESLRLLTLIPGGTPNTSAASSPLYNPSSPSSPTLLAPESSRLRSSSVGTPTGNGKATSSNGHGKMPTTSSLSSWADFSTAGFGESALDKTLTLSISDDVETTQPQRQAARAKSPLRGRRSSVDNPSPLAPSNDTSEARHQWTLKRVDLVQVDESFFDFWNDALLDPIATSWPAFAVCQLKGLRTSVLIVEQTYTYPAPEPARPEPTTRRAASPPPSIAPSVGSARKSFSFSPTMRRFSFFSSNDGASRTATKKTGAKSGAANRATPRIGEMGEILSEENEHTPPVPAKKASPGLPAVPLVDAPAPSPPAEVAPVATKPVRSEADAPEKPTATVLKDIAVPKDDTSVAEASGANKELPAAPEGVVLAGATPGPQVALESSEIKTLVEAQEAKAAEETSAPEPVTTQAEAETTAPQEQTVAAPEPAPEPTVSDETEPADTASSEPVHEEPNVVPSVPEPTEAASTVPDEAETTVPAEAATITVIEEEVPQSEDVKQSVERVLIPEETEQAEGSEAVEETAAEGHAEPEQSEHASQVVEPEVEEEASEPETKEEKPAEPEPTEAPAPEEPAPVTAVEPVEPTLPIVTAEPEPEATPEKVASVVEEADERAEEPSHANGTSHPVESSTSQAADDTQESESHAAEEPHA
ncbi:hypothetical protein PHLGIDRAFT_452814 [Phlebiopsis gigantea 11061_1 CR5-6]|uniref:Meiotically up-regulated protein Msb1/Mug8 domain-containing protein n=1 Tax=Phlebiopsis gigantea (strain 11061_1 CR5-6) TaxID=745531 RepID=A0A0C3S9X9_PHLG1|nr:hypothetical protein PHLGIDRAFT_452814 [Phlebiopsis gigantea 11061_1 CR5-6]